MLPLERTGYAVNSLDQVFDVLAFFAIFLATLQVIGLLALRGVVQSLEPWNPRPAPEAPWA